MKRLNSLFCSVAYSVMEQPDEDDERMTTKTGYFPRLCRFFCGAIALPGGG